MMLPQSIKDDLDELANWLRWAEMVEVGDRTWRCKDPCQLDRLCPLLKKLNLYERGFLFSLLKTAGRTKIIKDYRRKNLVIPLSGHATICGHHLKPGMCIYLTRHEVVEGNLDFLMVSMPEDVSEIDIRIKTACVGGCMLD
ncbi:hypothetical protein VTN31DRAFT_4866 [Thermomyces dupontii]|uniref:uncharacterized protein n=1 Tax=Talaromyces thermophilus TaxID=28565 RepID=UPI0037448C40